MSDFKFIAFVVFLFIVFSAFMALFADSQQEYLIANNITVENTSQSQNISSYDQIKNMTDYDTGSNFGKLFLGGLAVLLMIVVIRFVRGQ